MNTRQRLIAHIRQPQGLFQLIGLTACIAIFVAQMQEGPPAEGEALALTIGNQALPEQLFGGLVSDPAVFSGSVFVALVFAIFAAALVMATWGRRRSVRTRISLAAVQMLIGVLVSNDLLLVLAAQLPIMFRPRAALLGLAMQSLGMVIAW
ncbi:MAG TPA: hypothetical protein VF389_00420, partial [Woeseiaceae bacterium]